jgi:adenylate cyclase
LKSKRLQRLVSRAFPVLVSILCFGIGGALLRLNEPATMTQLRNLTFDEFQNWNPRLYDPDLPVRIVTIDEASLDKLGQWPWPRGRVAELTEKLTELGAAAIAYDFVFSEPDRLSRAQIAEMVQPGPQREALLSALQDFPDGDESFQRVVQAAPVVLGTVLGGGDLVQTQKVGQQYDKAGVAFAGDPPGDFLPGFDRVELPLPELAQAATGLGALNWVPGRDQIVRRVPLMFHLSDGSIVPSLASEALRVAQGAGTFVLRSSNASGQSAFGAATGVNAIRIGAFDVPTMPDGSLLLHYTRADPRRLIPAWQVMDGSVAAEQVAGRIILVGATAPGLFDLQATPLDNAIAGIEINAQVLEHIVTGSHIARPDWASGLEFLVFVALVVIFGISAAVFTPLTVAVLGAGIAAILWGSSFAAFSHYGLFIDPSFPGLGSGLSLFVLTSWIAVRERADRRWVRNAFGHYVSEELVEKLVQDQDGLKLGGELRPMTILFSDIRNFTTRAEGMDAQELTGYINDLLTTLTEVVMRNGGTIDKYMGDAIMAFWNAPLDDPEHASRACKAALEMLQALDRFNEENAGKYPVTEIGIGLNTGICCVGNLGSSQRFDYSVIGDDVNVASRLESQTKTYGTSILIGAETARQASEAGFVSVPIDSVRVQGKLEETEIFSLLGGPGTPVAAGRADAADRIARLCRSYRDEDLTTAGALLRDAALQTSDEFAAVVELYRERIAFKGAQSESETMGEAQGKMS